MDFLASLFENCIWYLLRLSLSDITISLMTPEIIEIALWWTGDLSRVSRHWPNGHWKETPDCHCRYSSSQSHIRCFMVYFNSDLVTQEPHKEAIMSYIAQIKYLYNSNISSIKQNLNLWYLKLYLYNVMLHDTPFLDLDQGELWLSVLH